MFRIFILVFVIIFSDGNECQNSVEHEADQNDAKIWAGQGYTPLGPPWEEEMRKMVLKEQRPIIRENKPLFLTNLSLVQLGENYYYFAKKQVNFFQAFEFCKKNHMELVSIESQAENDLINRHMFSISMNDTWISGSDLGKEGSFVWWSTGQPITFASWHKFEMYPKGETVVVSEPNNANNEEHCMHIRQYLHSPQTLFWNDVNCLEKKTFICETSPMFEFCMKKHDLKL